MKIIQTVKEQTTAQRLKINTQLNTLIYFFFPLMSSRDALMVLIQLTSNMKCFSDKFIITSCMQFIALCNDIKATLLLF